MSVINNTVGKRGVFAKWMQGQVNQRYLCDITLEEFEEMENNLDTQQQLDLVSELLAQDQKPFWAYNYYLTPEIAASVWLRCKIDNLSKNIRTLEQWQQWVACAQSCHRRLYADQSFRTNFCMSGISLKQSMTHLSDADYHRIRTIFMNELGGWYQMRNAWGSFVSFKLSCFWTKTIYQTRDVLDVVANVVGDVGTHAPHIFENHLSWDPLTARKYSGTMHDLRAQDVLDFWRDRASDKQKKLKIMQACLVDTGLLCKDVLDWLIAPFVW